MARVFDLDLSCVNITNKDFGGAKFGPESRQFSVILEDQNIIQSLLRDGVNLYVPPTEKDEALKAYMNVKVSYRFCVPAIALVTPEGAGFCFDEQNVDELNNAWLRDHSVEMHVHGSTYERMGRVGITVYLDTFVGYLMSKEERDAIAEEYRANADPVRDKYKALFASLNNGIKQ